MKRRKPSKPPRRKFLDKYTLIGPPPRGVSHTEVKRLLAQIVGR